MGQKEPIYGDVVKALLLPFAIGKPPKAISLQVSLSSTTKDYRSKNYLSLRPQPELHNDSPGLKALRLDGPFLHKNIVTFILNVNFCSSIACISYIAMFVFCGFSYIVFYLVCVCVLPVFTPECFISVS